MSFDVISYNSFIKIHCFASCPYKCLSDPIWPWLKTGQGQPRANIWTNLDRPESKMLHTKFKGHQPFSPEKKIFEGFSPYMGMVAILVSPRSHAQTFILPSHRDSHRFDFNQLTNFREVKNTEPEASRTKVSKLPWPLILIKVHLADCINQRWCHRLQQKQKNPVPLFPIQKA